MEKKYIKASEARSGYSKKFYPNKNWKEQKCICQWEHCIENMPLEEERGFGSCPVFGHNCPGGVKDVSRCSATIDDFISRLDGRIKK